MRFLSARNAAPRRPRHRIFGMRVSWLVWGGAGFGSLALATLTGWWLHDTGRIAGFVETVEGKVIAWSVDAGFVLADLQVEGREMTSREAILRVLNARRGAAILALSPDQARAELERLPWVRSAAVERRLPDTLRIQIVERKPLALWQRGGKLVLIDTEGVVIPTDNLDRFRHLMTVVGEDAPQHAAALVEMLALEPALAKRAVAAIRIGGRRWNLRLDNGVDVQLPEENPAAAWLQLAQLERAHGVLGRDVQVVDLRLPDRLVVRTSPSEPPAKEPVKKTKPKNT